MSFMDDDYDDKNYDYGDDDDGGGGSDDYGVNGVDISVKLFLVKLLH